VYLPPESSDSLDYNETLAHVPISSSQLGEYAYGSSFAEESESAFLNDVESDSSETASIKSESDSSETELDNDEDMTIFSGLASTILSLSLHQFICSYLLTLHFILFLR
jgi:hypothetical protein